jgi:hypothetical protein
MKFNVSITVAMSITRLEIAIPLGYSLTRLDPKFYTYQFVYRTLNKEIIPIYLGFFTDVDTDGRTFQLSFFTAKG